MIQAALIVLFTLCYAGAAEAGPVIPAIVAAAQGFAATAMGAAMIQTAVTMGLSALARMALAKDPEAREGAGTEQTTEGETTPLKLIFGRMATNGHLNCPPYVYETDGNPGEWMIYVIELMDGQINGLGDVFIDGERATFKTSPLNPTGTGLGATVNGKYENKAFFRVYRGNQTAADPYLRSVIGNFADRPWTADMILKGVSYAIVTLKGRAADKVFSGGFPPIRFEVDGLSLTDPRDGQVKMTHNPMVMAWNVCRGITLPNGDVWGYDMQAADIVSGPAIAAMNACDEMVTTGSGTEPRYRAAIEFGVDEEPSEILQHLFNVCNGDFADMGGEVILNAGAPSPPVYYFTDTDVMATSDEEFNPFRGLDQTKNAVHASYPDPESNWEVKDAVPLYNAAWEAEDGGRRLVAELRLRACPYKRQVRRVMREVAADHRRQRNHQVTLPPDAGNVRLLDDVSWTSTRNRYSNKLFEVIQKTVDPVSGCVMLQIRERDPSDYIVDPVRDGVFPPIGPSGPVEPTPLPVEGWAVTAVNAGGRPGIRIAWNPEVSAEFISIQVKRNDDHTQIVANQEARDVDLGYKIITAGLKPLTAYRVEGAVVRGGRRSVQRVTVVTTLDIGFGRSDFEDAVDDMLKDFEDFIGEVPGLIEESVSVVRESVAATNSRVDDELAGLELDVQNARQLAIDNLAVAKSYTETKVSTETVARKLETGQLAARLDEITAAVTSNNLLVNPDFADGTTGWTGVTVASGKGTVTAAGAQQTPEVTFGVAELLQWRIEHTGPAATVRVAFLTAANAVIGSEFVTNLAATATMKVASGQHPPPDNAAKVRFRVVGTGLVIDNAAVSKIDQQIIARLQTLEVALATDEAALVSYKSEVTTKFGEANTRITEEIAARSSAVGAVASRTTNLETTMGSHGTRIGTTETAITNLNESIAQVQTLVESESGRRDVVRDGTFVAVSNFWNTGALTIQPWRVQPRLLTSGTVAIRDMPAPRALQLRSTDVGGTYLNHIRQSVTPGEKLEVSFDYYWTATAQPEPGLQVGFFTAAGVQIGGNVAVRPLTRPARWNKRSETIDVPDTAVEVRIAAGVITAGTGAASYMTNVSGIRTGEGYASRATVETLSQTVTDDKKALADYQITAGTRFTNVETKAQSSADAILNMYSKSDANSAMAGQINTYHSTVVQPGLNARASASAVDLLTTRVRDTELGLTAEATKLDQLIVTSNKFSASGTFRVSVGANPQGASSRIAIAAAANAGSAATIGGIYIDAMTATGKSRILLIADQFAISSAAGGVPEYPFTVISGQGIRMDANAWIKNLSVDTLSIAGQAVTIPASARATAQLNGGVGTSHRQLLSVTMNRQGARTLIMASIQIINNGATGEPAWLFFEIMRNGVVIDIFHAETSSRSARNITIASMFVDTDTGTGATTYTLHDSGAVGSYGIQTRALIAMHVKR